MVTGVPSLAMAASAACARCRVCSWRARACSASLLAWSAGIIVLLGGCRRAGCAGARPGACRAASAGSGEPADDGDQVLFDGPVHLGHPLLATLLGLADQGAGLGELAAVLGQELGGGNEDRAGQAP